MDSIRRCGGGHGLPPAHHRARCERQGSARANHLTRCPNRRRGSRIPGFHAVLSSAGSGAVLGHGGFAQLAAELQSARRQAASASQSLRRSLQTQAVAGGYCSGFRGSAPALSTFRKMVFFPRAQLTNRTPGAQEDLSAAKPEKVKNAKNCYL